MSRRGVSRKEDKQISFFTSSQIHESIKQEAKNNNTTIKDYIVGLHLNAIKQDTQDNLIIEIHDMLRTLTENQSFIMIPQHQQSNVTLPTTGQPSKRDSTAFQSKNDRFSSTRTVTTDQSKKLTDNIDPLLLPPQLESYVNGITRTNTHNTMREILLTLLKLREATHYEINREIGHTTHNQPRALKRAVEDNIVYVDEPENPKEPYYYRINPAYL